MLSATPDAFAPCWLPIFHHHDVNVMLLRRQRFGFSLTTSQCVPVPDTLTIILRFAIEREEDEAVILAILANPACEAIGDGLADLAERIPENGAVLAAMASNHRLPPEVLGTVFHCAVANGKGYEGILLALLRNPGFSSDYFYEIVDEHGDVEAILPAVAARVDCDSYVLAKVVWLCYGEAALSSLAKRNPNWSTEEWLSFLDEEVDRAPDIVAGDPDCPPSMFERLWRDWGSSVKKELLANPACPSRILVEASLAKDREEDSDEFTASLADVAMENPSNPLVQAEGAADAEAFATLSASQFPKVVVRVAANSLCPANLLRSFPRYASNSGPESVSGGTRGEGSRKYMTAGTTAAEARSASRNQKTGWPRPGLKRSAASANRETSATKETPT